MKILFIITGVGLGHSTRDEAVIKKIIEKNKNAKIHVAAFDLAYDYFKEKYFSTEISGLRLSEGKFKFSIAKTILKNWNFLYIWLSTFFKLRRTIKHFNPDKVVIDFEPIAALAARSCNVEQVALFNYDAELFKEYRKQNKSINLLIQSLYFKATYNLVKGKKIVASFFKSGFKNGYNYVQLIIRDKKADLEPENKILKKFGLKKKPILVSIGGSGLGMFLIEEILKLAKHFKDEEFVFFCDRHLKGSNYACMPFSPNFLEYLKVCKGVITLAGHSTLSEILAYKKPSLIYPIPNYIEQELNCYPFEKKNIAIVRRYRKGMSIKKDIAEFIKNIPILQNKMSELKIRTDGADKVAEIIIS